MTVSALIEALRALDAEEDCRGDMQICFGDRKEPDEGGIVGNRAGLAVLNFAPLRLDRVGGFWTSFASLGTPQPLPA